MGDELVATYIYGTKKIHIYGCWDEESTAHFDYYDVYDEGGHCLNLGDQFYKMPTRKDCEYYAKQLVG